MSYKNKNQNEAGKLRATITCPNCGCICIVRNSYAVTTMLRKQYVHCTGPICGWSGVAMTETMYTLSSPHPDTVRDDNNIPPLADSKTIKEFATDGQLF